MPNEATPNWVRPWVLGLCALVVTMVLVGGATRLTDSGLSITEWKPISGALPPMSEAAWAAEFAKYQTSSEYHLQNFGMTLAAFKQIFWWEWGHRLLGRLIGGYLLLPLLFLTFTRRLDGARLARLWLIGVLVGFQGFIGWWMVSSGLVNRVDVSPLRLATHLGVALIILGLSWHLWLRWNDPKPVPGSLAARPLGAWPIILTGLIFGQMLLGGLVAGLDAGRSHTDWPTIDGRMLPHAYGALEPFLRNFYENTQAVQFNHRMMGYLAGATALFVAFRFKASAHRKLAMATGHMALLQVVLGIIAVITASPLWIGMLHQAGALCLFMLANALWVRSS